MPVDISKVSQSRYFDSNFYIVPTKSSVLISELTNCFLNVGLNVEVYGGQQIGKTSFLKLIKGAKINLSIYNKT